MSHMPIDPRTGQVIAPSFGGLVEAVLASLRHWNAQRRATIAQRRAARVASELSALPDIVLKRLGLARRGRPS
jgi:hypothetical protein